MKALFSDNLTSCNVSSFRSLILIAACCLISSSEAQQRTASATVNCRSVNWSPISRFDPVYGTLSTYFTTYDGNSSIFPLAQDLGNGTILFSGEVRPRANQPGIYESDFATFSSVYGWVQYGSIVSTFPTTDIDGNGLPDIAQLDKAVNTTFSGSIRVDWPSVGNDTFTGTLVRGANQLSGSYTVRFASDGSTASGTMRVQNGSGSVSYSRGSANTMAFTLSQSDPLSGFSRTLTGSTDFTVNNANQITIPQFNVSASDGSIFTVLAGTVLNRTGHRYAGNLAVVDGLLETSWRDHIDWVIEVVDNNDSDGNGIPDLSDALPVPPTITTQPQSTNAIAGSNVTFTVVASGTPPLSYQWLHNGTNLPGATIATLQIVNAQPANEGTYLVTVSNPVTSIQSSPATLTLLFPPAISLQPLNQTVLVGDSVSFNVTATGTAPLSFQWRFNGTNIPSTTGSTLSLQNVQTTNAGAYSVLVTNIVGTQLSSNANLTVNAPPHITTQPRTQSLRSGSNVTFTVVATGTAPLAYQWQLRATNIPNATSASLLINNVQLSAAGDYRVLVNNVAGSLLSDIATLYVDSPLIFRNAKLLTNGTFQAQLIAIANSNYLMQASTDLTNWTSIATNTSAVGIIFINDTNGTRLPKRFFRARLK